MTQSGYYTANELISEITGINGDETYRNGLSKGWYTSQIKDALEELAFDIFFKESIEDMPFPDNFKLKIPEGVFNIREVYLYNQSCCGEGTDSVKVYWKRLFKPLPTTGNNGTAGSYTANVKEAGEGNNNYIEGLGDPFFGSYVGSGYETIYYYGIQDDCLVFSSGCTGYDSVRIVANSMGVETLGDAPIIPRMYKEFVKYFVLDIYYQRMKAQDRAYRTDYADNLPRLMEAKRKARVRKISMDTAAKADLLLYLTNLQFK